MKKFDAENCPLGGINLVEASAGTGKTYNIQLLVLRLLLEKEVPLREILVVTFTVFATYELMTRLHSILLLAGRAFDLCRENASAIKADEFEQVRNIVSREIEKGEERRGECVELIKKALADFDQASVMTIHGFCQRMLLDNAFASKVNFGIELKEDIGDIRHEIAMDFMRIIRCSTRDDFVLGRILDESITADWLLDKLGPALGNAENGVEICWQSPSDASGQEPSDASLQEQLEALNDQAAQLPDAVEGQFKPGALGPCFLAFYRERLAKLKAEENFFTFDDLIRMMAEIVADEKNGAALRKAIRENYRYAFVDEFQDTDPLQYRIFSRIFGVDADGEDRGFFMIGDPKQAIYSFRGGDIFAYQIACGEVPEERRYTLSENFRSSEEYIGVLNKFFGEFSQEFPVPEIEFGGRKKLPFCKNGKPVPVDDLLQFDAVCTGDIGAAAVEKIMELLYAGYTLEDPNTHACRPVSASDIAVLFPTKGKGAEIEAMLNKAGLDTVWMSDSDIFQKPEAKALYDLLKMLHDGCSFSQILAVLAGDIFQCTATELSRLQKNGVFTEDEQKRFDGTAEAAQAYFLKLRKDWESQGFYVMFRKLMFAPNSAERQWLIAIRDDGRFEEEGTLAQHLISCDFIDGRYGLGRLRQLGEILHQAEQARRLTPGRLLGFLLGKIEHDSSAGDGGETAALIQRSTDLDAVRLLTLHSSKGLQFPIVIIPGVITHKPKKTSRLFHGMPPPDGIRRIDMTGWWGNAPNRNQAYASACEREMLEEKKRLLYVGLTRAKYFCYLSFSNSDRGVDCQFRDMLPWLDFPATHGSFDVARPATCDEKSQVRTFSGEIVRDWNLVSFSGIVKERSGGKSSSAEAGALSPQDVSGGTDELSAEDGPESPTGGLGAGALPGDDAQESIFKFGSGSDMGTVWHEIFEKMDFDPEGLAPDGFFDAGECEAVLKAIDTTRSLYRYIRKRKEEDEESRNRDFAFARMLKGLLYNPMGRMNDPGGERFRLRDIPDDRRASELKFMFVLKENVTLPRIKACLERYGVRTGNWANSAALGYADRPMIGFIDLLCQSASGKYYIIDWKSNRLNAELTGFDRAGMAAEVEKKLYALQFLLYTVGLWHFLKARQNIELTGENYERYFGGVLYLFIRGVAAPLRGMSEGEANACRERGIYFELPPFELIKDLKEMLEIRPLAPAEAERSHEAVAEAEK